MAQEPVEPLIAAMSAKARSYLGGSSRRPTSPLRPRSSPAAA